MLLLFLFSLFLLSLFLSLFFLSFLSYFFIHHSFHSDTSGSFGGQNSNILLSVHNCRNKSGAFHAESNILLMKMAHEFTNLWG